MLRKLLFHFTLGCRCADDDAVKLTPGSRVVWKKNLLARSSSLSIPSSLKMETFLLTFLFSAAWNDITLITVKFIWLIKILSIFHSFLSPLFFCHLPWCPSLGAKWESNETATQRAFFSSSRLQVPPLTRQKFSQILTRPNFFPLLCLPENELPSLDLLLKWCELCSRRLLLFVRRAGEVGAADGWPTSATMWKVIFYLILGAKNSFVHLTCLTILRWK